MDNQQENLEFMKKLLTDQEFSIKHTKERLEVMQKERDQLIKVITDLQKLGENAT